MRCTITESFTTCLPDNSHKGDRMDYKSLITSLKNLKIEYSENVPLAPYTTFRIGGAARLAVFPKNSDEAVSVFELLANRTRILVLGNGSNVLVSDNGFDGVAVILSGMKNIRFDGDRITADAGVSLTHLAAEAAKMSLSGLEFAYGIPGTVGGGIYMNAGAYGGDMSQVVVKSRYFDPSSGTVGELCGEEHEFAYRHSAYMNRDYVILSAELQLSNGCREEIFEKMNDYMSRRREKQPLEYPSAGSVFKRGDGFITAQVIDMAGLKGRSVGGAQVSCKHAGFIINRGGATAADVLELIEIIKAEIKEKFGYDIECEVRYIGG